MTDYGILLVTPDFPVSTKSKNHKDFIPVGLLKLANYYKSQGSKIHLSFGKDPDVPFIPNKILITSLFTYWSEYVWDCAEFYRKSYPKSKIYVGGIYTSLNHDTVEFQEKLRKFNAKAFIGQDQNAEKCIPLYSLIGNVDFHVMHATRGCIRKCSFCGTWKIEPEFKPKSLENILQEITSVGKNRIVFYDNNLLAHPQIYELLDSISKLKVNDRSITCESQSGFDGRLLTSEMAKSLKKARFQYPRIAWDGKYSDCSRIKKQIDLLCNAGYTRKDIFVFMIYNFDIPFEEMERKRKKGFEWGVQIVDCRYRPLTQLYDRYKPNAKAGTQTSKDYYIHKSADWTDEKIRVFRRNVRKQNIGIRYGGTSKKYIESLEKRFSPLRSLFKRFGVKELTPRLDEFDKSRSWQRRVELMKKIRNRCEVSRTVVPSLTGLTISRIDKKLEHFAKN